MPVTAITERGDRTRADLPRGALELAAAMAVHRIAVVALYRAVGAPDMPASD
jgi:hypothetical protein